MEHEKNDIAKELNLALIDKERVELIGKYQVLKDLISQATRMLAEAPAKETISEVEPAITITISQNAITRLNKFLESL